MKSVSGAHGEAIKLLGAFLMAFVSVILSSAFPSGKLSFLFKDVPCLGLGLLSGLLYIFWLALAREVYGRGWGTVVSVLVVSVLLLNGPWYGVVNPYYFGVFGFLSFLVMGILTDFKNGGLGAVLCLLINWSAFYAFKGIYPSFVHGVIVLILTFLSGFAFDRLARFTSKRLFRA